MRRTVLVSGAGGGIGAAIATTLAGEGWFVGVLDRDGDAAREVAGALGERAVAIVADAAACPFGSEAHRRAFSLIAAGSTDLEAWPDDLAETALALRIELAGAEPSDAELREVRCGGGDLLLQGAAGEGGDFFAAFLRGGAQFLVQRPGQFHGQRRHGLTVVLRRSGSSMVPFCRPRETDA